MESGQLLVASGVRKVYRSTSVDVEALRDLDLVVSAGEMVAVMGPSGSGKTTLLNCLSGLDEIDGGSVRVEGRDLFAMSDADRTEHRARSMGFVLQAFNLIPVSVLGVATTWLMYQKSASFDGIRESFPLRWRTVGSLAAATLAASLLATLAPGRRAAAVRPALAVRVAT